MPTNKKYVLISTTDDSLRIDTQIFDNKKDAQTAMREDYKDAKHFERGGDCKITNNDAIIVGYYTHLWKIIEVCHV